MKTLGEVPSVEDAAGADPLSAETSAWPLGRPLLVLELEEACARSRNFATGRVVPGAGVAVREEAAEEAAEEAVDDCVPRVEERGVNPLIGVERRGFEGTAVRVDVEED